MTYNANTVVKATVGEKSEEGGRVRVTSYFSEYWRTRYFAVLISNVVFVC